MILCAFLFFCSTTAEGTPPLAKINYVTWDDDMDAALLEVLVHHHNMGDHLQNGWKAHVYTATIKNVKEKFSKDITKENVLGKLRTFDKKFQVISKILSQSGFVWDWVNHKLSIDSDVAKTKNVEVNNAKEKGIGLYKTKVVRHWYSISTIYSKDHANGEGVMTVLRML
ncbi:hypothetical protein ZWY2020_033825 [Hordeum vulgare]|nr:hypothetical protein ZWY2020_033825 [Hordeum vulgare]